MSIKLNDNQEKDNISEPLKMTLSDIYPDKDILRQGVIGIDHHFSFVFNCEFFEEEIKLEESFPEIEYSGTIRHDRVKRNLLSKPHDEKSEKNDNTDHLLISQNQHKYFNTLKSLFNDQDERVSQTFFYLESKYHSISSPEEFLSLFCKILKFLLDFDTRVEFMRFNKKLLAFVDITSKDEVLTELAIKYDYSLQVKRDLKVKSVPLFEDEDEDLHSNRNNSKIIGKFREEFLDIYNNLKPDPFTPHIPIRGNLEIFQKYENNDEFHFCSNLNRKEDDVDCCNNTNISMFRNIDKERLIIIGLKSVMKFNEIMENRHKEIVEDSLILHKYKLYYENFKYNHLYVTYLFPIDNIDVHKLNNDFRNFYGEDVGFYFLWISHYIKCLSLPILLFFSYYAFRISLFMIFGDHEWIKIVVYIMKFSLTIFMLFWGNYYTRSWTTLEKFMNYCWGSDSYKFDVFHDKKIGTGSSYKYLDFEIPNQTRFKFFLTKFVIYSITFIFILLSVSVNLLVFYIQNILIYTDDQGQLSRSSFRKVVNEHWVYISPLIMFIMRETLSYIFCFVVAPVMVNWEIHNTKKSKRNSLILNTFFFQFFNYYFMFYYIAFIKFYYEACLGGSCYDELNFSVKSLLLLTILSDLFDYLVLRFWVKIKHDKEVKKIKSYLDIEKKNNSKTFRSNEKFIYLIKQKYDDDAIIKEYMSIIMNYGYIIQFGSVSPVCFLLAMIQAIISRLFDSVKFGNILYVNFIDGSDGIDIFLRLIKMLTFFGFTSSILINLFTNTNNMGFNNTTKWIIAFAFENFSVFWLFFIKYDFLPTWFDYIEKIKNYFISKSQTEIKIRE